MSFFAIHLPGSLQFMSLSPSLSSCSSPGSLPKFLPLILRVSVQMPLKEVLSFSCHHLSPVSSRMHIAVETDLLICTLAQGLSVSLECEL